jgi:hypothetical protein
MGEPALRNSVYIDSRHSRAIVKEVGERLRASLTEDRELPANFQKQIERLRQSEERGAGERCW